MKTLRSFAVALVLTTALATTAGSAGAQESPKGKGSFTKIPTIKGIEILKVGTPAPDFTVKDLADKEFTLKDCCNRDAVILFFWSFFCGPCREEMPLINQAAMDYAGKGLQVIGVNLDGREMKKAIDKFVVSEKVSFRIVFDELDGDSFKVADPYGVAGTPALFLIDKKGVISFTTLGALTADRLKTEIGKVLK